MKPCATTVEQCERQVRILETRIKDCLEEAELHLKGAQEATGCGAAMVVADYVKMLQDNLARVSNYCTHVTMWNTKLDYEKIILENGNGEHI